MPRAEIASSDSFQWPSPFIPAITGFPSTGFADRVVERREGHCIQGLQEHRHETDGHSVQRSPFKGQETPYGQVASNGHLFWPAKSPGALLKGSASSRPPTHRATESVSCSSGQIARRSSTTIRSRTSSTWSSSYLASADGPNEVCPGPPRCPLLPHQPSHDHALFADQPA